MSEGGSDPARAGTVSKVTCTLAVRGKGEASVALYRHLAPLTVTAILEVVPLQSRASVQQGMVCMFTEIKVGVEKGRIAFEKGEIAFVPSAGLICCFTRSVRSERPLNPVGKIESGVELLDKVKIGDVLQLGPAHDAPVQT